MAKSEGKFAETPFKSDTMADINALNKGSSLRLDLLYMA